MRGLLGIDLRWLLDWCAVLCPVQKRLTALTHLTMGFSLSLWILDSTQEFRFLEIQTHRYWGFHLSLSQVSTMEITLLHLWSC